jgi:hypothetical protein
MNNVQCVLDFQIAFNCLGSLLIAHCSLFIIHYSLLITHCRHEVPTFAPKIKIATKWRYIHSALCIMNYELNMHYALN